MIIEWMFEKLFKTYHFPFAKSDELIGKMQDAERTEYYRQAKDLLENRVFVQELQELIRTYYAELACKSTSKVEQNAYRLTLKSIQDLEKRVRVLGMMYKSPIISNSLNKM